MVLGLILMCVLLAGVGLLEWRASRPSAAPLALVSMLALALSLTLAYRIAPMTGDLLAITTVALVAAASVGGVGPVGFLLAAAVPQVMDRGGLHSGRLPASKAIGVVERFAVVSALALGLPEVAALILGVKALGQYAEHVTDPDTPATGNVLAAERVMGTLISLSWALMCYAAIVLART